MHRNSRIQNIIDRRNEYKEFLQTDFWINISKTKKDLMGNRCEGCDALENLQCHHKIYRESWFWTKLDDLIVVCGGCHKKLHFDRVRIIKSKHKDKHKIFHHKRTNKPKWSSDRYNFFINLLAFKLFSSPIFINKAIYIICNNKSNSNAFSRIKTNIKFLNYMDSIYKHDLNFYRKHGEFDTR